MTEQTIPELTSSGIPAPHGPGPVPSLRPGARASVMIIAPATDPSEAMRCTVEWIDAFEQGCGLALDREETCLYAMSVAADVTSAAAVDPHGPGPCGDSPCGVAKYLDAILCGGAWQVRGDDPHEWARTYRQALAEADPAALCTVWDVLALP